MQQKERKEKMFWFLIQPESVAAFGTEVICDNGETVKLFNINQVVPLEIGIFDKMMERVTQTLSQEDSVYFIEDTVLREKMITKIKQSLHRYLQTPAYHKAVMQKDSKRYGLDGSITEISDNERQYAKEKLAEIEEQFERKKQKRKAQKALDLQNQQIVLSLWNFYNFLKTLDSKKFINQKQTEQEFKKRHQHVLTYKVFRKFNTAKWNIFDPTTRQGIMTELERKYPKFVNDDFVFNMNNKKYHIEFPLVAEENNKNKKNQSHKKKTQVVRKKTPFINKNKTSTSSS